MKVSILMCVYNSETYLKRCIQSIQNQTYRDFEAIIIDDGSTDLTSKILDDIKDSRFRIFHRQHGYITSLNYGLQIVRGEYIARMDADDIMMPNRIETQVNVLDNNPEVAVCSSWIKIFGEGLEEKNIKKASGKLDCPYIQLLDSNYICHPATMIRKNFIDKHHIQYKEYIHAEDYKLWCDIALAGGDFWIIPEVLLAYRISSGQVSSKYYHEQNKTAMKIKKEILLTILNDDKITCHEELQKIYLELEKINNMRLLSGNTIFHIISILSKEIHTYNRK